MAMGYEGLVKLGSYYVLGTGSSVPRTRIRLESSAGYGGKIQKPASEARFGIGAPFNYDWSQVDSSISFEMSRDIWLNEVKTWLFYRQTPKEIVLSSRKDNIQQYETCFFNSISISASDGGVVDGSVGFMALEQTDYAWGDLYANNRKGSGLICTDATFPSPLNADANRSPIPFWNTSVLVKLTSGSTAVKKNFTTWSLDFSQEVVKFFGCRGNMSTPQEPKYIAVGPMTVIFSGSYMDDFTGTQNGFLGDHLYQIEVNIAGTSIKLLRCEGNSESDDVQSGDATVPLTVEYSAYEIMST
jgi:hypothetical protein